jgi:hypothetical protein
MPPHTPPSSQSKPSIKFLIRKSEIGFKGLRYNSQSFLLNSQDPYLVQGWFSQKQLMNFLRSLNQHGCLIIKDYQVMVT